MNSMSPRTNLTIMLTVALVLIGALVLATEYYLRANDARRFVRATTIPGLKYELVPSYRGTYKGVEYRTNAFGFRGADFPMRKPAGEYRILFLGDSIVQGGLVEEQAAMGARLEALWQTQPEHARTRVINAGVSSYDANDYLALYQHKGVKFDPDFVIVGLFLNDNFRYIAKEKFDAVTRPPRWWERSVLLRTIADVAALAHDRSFDPAANSDPVLLAQIASAIPDPPSVHALVQFFNQRRYPLELITREALPFVFDLHAWEQVRTPVAALARLVQEHHAGLLFVVLPVEFQLAQGYHYPQPQQFIMEMCAAHGIDVIDATPVLRKLQIESGRSVYHQRGDMIHFDGTAHAAIAQTIFEHMRPIKTTSAR